jgi:signal peptidase I
MPTHGKPWTSPLTWLRFLICGVTLLVVSSFDLLTVSSESMAPTLRPGDVIVVDAVRSTLRRVWSTQPQRGQLVVYRTDDGRAEVKRLIGVPRDTLQIVHHRLFVNGRAVPEPYVKYVSPTPIDEDWPLPDNGGRVNTVTVPDDRYFVLGDNRDRSFDSRQRGSLMRSAVIGVVRLTWRRGPRDIAAIAPPAPVSALSAAAGRRGNLQRVTALLRLPSRASR